MLLCVVIGQHVGWPDHLAKFDYFAVAGLVVITILRALVNRLLLPGTTLHMAIERDRNPNAAWIEGSVAIGAAATVFFML